MEIKWKPHCNGFAGRLTGSLLVFALTLGLVAATPGLDGETRAVDLNQNCSLTVAPVDLNKTEIASDLANAQVEVDLYRIADVQPVDGYDTYTYQFLDGYTELESIYSASPNNADWKKMAQEAAAYVRDNKEQPDRTGAVNSSIDGLKSGLYLLIARGSDYDKDDDEDGVKDYWTIVKQADASQEGEAGESIATRAHSDRYEYTYSPEIISLPGKEGNTTAGNGAWLYNMDVSLKPQQSRRYGSLEIVKTLLNYEVKDPATFIFDVEAVLGSETVFRDNVALTFDKGDETGKKSVVLKNRIPVGAEVKVTEVYSGSVYELTSSPTQTTVIEANNIVSVAFTNDYNETNRGGGSVTNSFKQSETGWSLQKIYDDGRVEEQGKE